MLPFNRKHIAKSLFVKFVHERGIFSVFEPEIVFLRFLVEISVTINDKHFRLFIYGPLQGIFVEVTFRKFQISLSQLL